MVAKSKPELMISKKAVKFMRVSKKEDKGSGGKKMTREELKTMITSSAVSAFKDFERF